MNKKIRWITETAVMLALLVSLQALTKPMGQWVTGPCVNTVLAEHQRAGVSSDDDLMNLRNKLKERKGTHP